jgi:hypothetical protein
MPRFSFLHIAFSLFLASAIACGEDGAATGGDSSSGGDSAGDGDGGTVTSQGFTVLNAGNGAMEGHTPRGFQGMGTGLFAGDNLNSGFPNGDGVQIFLSFDITGVPNGTVHLATLSTDNGSVTGTPYQDLGSLTAEEIRYDSFSAALWNLPAFAGGHSCVFATSATGPFECDIGPAVQRALTDGRDFAQVRLLFDTAGDSDGQQDLAMFFISDSNTNEPGIFELLVEMVSG